MSVPQVTDLLLPLLKTLGDARVRTRLEIFQTMRRRLGPGGDRPRLGKTGARDSLLRIRVDRALRHLRQAALAERIGFGRYRIAAAGREFLAARPRAMDCSTLARFPAYVEGRRRRQAAAAAKAARAPLDEPTLAASWQAHRAELGRELLGRVKGCSPAFFERLVVRLLVAMGYGRSVSDAGRALGRGGDGGIDGVIHGDQLGLELLCIQAKRWEGTVGRPVVQAFAGSMEAFRAGKGVLLTTSTFTREAEEYVGRIGRQIVLIDGQRLTELMIDHDLGVSPGRAFAIKSIDPEFFVEAPVDRKSG